MNHEPAGSSMWRVSVASYNRVLFPDPESGTQMLALERRATLVNSSGEETHVWAQPFGGGVHILDPRPLQELIGEIRYDSERSRREGDLRILIPPSRWEAVKQYCLAHLQDPGDSALESLPDRELREEFNGSIGADLKPGQYAYRAAGFVIENNPVPSDNIYARGMPTVRLYRIFEVHILEDTLAAAMLAASQSYSDQDLCVLALQDFQRGGRGHANSVLALPLDVVSASYLALAPDRRYGKIRIENHELDESVLAVLGGIDVPQYQRL